MKIISTVPQLGLNLTCNFDNSVSRAPAGRQSVDYDSSKYLTHQTQEGESSIISAIRAFSLMFVRTIYCSILKIVGHCFRFPYSCEQFIENSYGLASTMLVKFYNRVSPFELYRSSISGQLSNFLEVGR